GPRADDSAAQSVRRLIRAAVAVRRRPCCLQSICRPVVSNLQAGQPSPQRDAVAAVMPLEVSSGHSRQHTCPTEMHMKYSKQVLLAAVLAGLGSSAVITASAQSPNPPPPGAHGPRGGFGHFRGGPGGEFTRPLLRAVHQLENQSPFNGEKDAIRGAVQTALKG